MKSSRLKIFCELCRKQCRDENGYICHLNSAIHKRRVEEYASNPQEHIEKYSDQLEHKFIQILKTKYPGEAKHLEEVFEEYSQEKRAVKISHTKWKNLTQFGKHLETLQNIKLSSEPPNCYITYTVSKTMDFIEKNRKEQLELLKQRQKEQFEKTMANKIERQKAFQQREAAKFQQQMEKMQKEKQSLVIPEKLQFNFENFTSNNKRNAIISPEELQKLTKEEEHKSIEEGSVLSGSNKLKNNGILLNRIEQQFKKKEDSSSQKVEIDNKLNKDNECEDDEQWVTEGIVVRIKPHEIDKAFHNKKVTVQKVTEPYVALVRLGTATLEIDQAYLQTVIPKIGNEIRVVGGNNKGLKGCLTAVDLKGGFGTIEPFQSQEKPQEKLRLPFNHFSKFENLTQH